MKFSPTALNSIFLNLASDSSLFNHGKGVTSYFKHVCTCISSGIAESHNQWQETVKINNILVIGGVCGDSGPLQNGIGTSTATPFSKKLTGTSNLILKKLSFDKVTAPQKEFIQTIAKTFEEIENEFYESCIIKNIKVSQGTCTCKIVSGAPVPGSYSSGVGILSSLSGNVSGSIPSKNRYKQRMIDNLTKSVQLGSNGITNYLKFNIDLISEGLSTYYMQWMEKTKIENLQVSGGVTIVGGPISGAIGRNGVLV